MKLTKKDKRTSLEKEIDKKIEALMREAKTQEELLSVMSLLSKRNEMETAKVKKRVSLDTIAIVVGNLVGIGMIIGYEKFNVITSKAINHVIRGRV